MALPIGAFLEVDPSCHTVGRLPDRGAGVSGMSRGEAAGTAREQRRVPGPASGRAVPRASLAASVVRGAVVDPVHDLLNLGRGEAGPRPPAAKGHPSSASGVDALDFFD